MKDSLVITVLQLTGALMLSANFATAQIPVPVPATGLCNTGLTPKGIQPEGCLSSTLATPVNPLNGGTTTDGNWELAAPYPSAPYTASAPNPCTISTQYTPAWVNAPWETWFNPADNLSQWIEPLGGGATAAGWYIYRTGFPVPEASTESSRYVLEINGQFLVDNGVVAIYLVDPASDGASCRAIETLTKTGGFSVWNQLHVAVADLFPGTHAYLYFVVNNVYQAYPVNENPTGLRLEFTDTYFLPY